jgi:hypothetical protein
MTDTETKPTLLRDLMTDEEADLFASFFDGEGYGTVEERVARGVRFLDRTQPDWRTRVEVKNLDLESECYCVLGQLFSNEAGTSDDHTDGYTWARDNLFAIEDTDALSSDQPLDPGHVADEVAVFFGFDRESHEDYDAYDVLTNLWAAQIGAQA